MGTACMNVLRKGRFEAAVGAEANDGVAGGTCSRGLLVFGEGRSGGVNTSRVMPGTKSTTMR